MYHTNSVTVIGYLGANPLQRNTRNNTEFITFSLAAKRSWKDRKSGEWQSRTDWHRAVVFGRLAERAASLTKGDRVQVQGRLQMREYSKSSESAATKQCVTEICATSILKLEANPAFHPEPVITSVA